MVICTRLQVNNSACLRGHHSEKDVQASLKMKSRKKRHKTDQVYVVKDITFPLASLSSGYDPLEQHWQKSTLLSKSFRICLVGPILQSEFYKIEKY